MSEGRARRLRAGAVSVSFFLLSLGVLGLLWSRDRRQWRESVETQVELTANQAALRLEDYVSARLLVVESFAEASARALARSTARRGRRAELAQERFGGFQAINWTDADSRIVVVTPLETNRQALGRRVLDHPVGHSAFERARASGEPRMTDALELFQGGRGFAAYYPFDGPQGRGYVNGVFRIRPLVDEALRGSVLEDYAVALEDDAGNHLLTHPAGSEAPEGRPMATGVVRLLDRTWNLHLWPQDRLWATMQSARSDAAFGIALLLLAIVAFLVHLAQVRQIDREAAERERRELQLQLERASKMEALGRLAGGVAHDFNNLLTAILNSAEILAESAELDPNGELAIEMITDACTRANDLTRQLLTFARHAPEPPQRLNLNEQLRGLEQMLRRLLPVSVELSLDLDPDLPSVRMSASHLGQIVVNLIVNAADAMPDGGQIELRTRSRGSSVVLEAEDTGAGMDAETRERIFEPFFSTKVGNRSGLGMATVYGIVQRYGGTIDVDSAPGDGTRFRVRFHAEPRDAAVDDETAGAPSPPPAALTRRRILLVEDDAAVRRTIRRGLVAYGHDVVETDDGQAALALLEEGPAFDAVVSDVSMPRMGGFELREKIRERHPTLPVVLCSGHTADRSERTEGAHDAYLDKPFQMAEMQAALERLCARA